MYILLYGAVPQVYVCSCINIRQESGHPADRTTHMESAAVEAIECPDDTRDLLLRVEREKDDHGDSTPSGTGQKSI